ncbi:MAG: M24 family metallopeptidase [Pirellulales bacterium]
MPFHLPNIQSALAEFDLDGWLLYDFRASNVLARRVLDIPADAHTSRRLAYAIPRQGTPRKLVHRIESGPLDHLPGDKHVYLRWQEFEAGLATLVSGMKRVAMEYVPRGANPYVSRVDAGTIELVREAGVDVVSSGDLIQMFESTWDAAAWQSHLASSRLTTAAFDMVWRLVADRVRGGGSIREIEVQQAIMDYFAANHLVTDHPPIVGVGPHSGDPHYAPNKENENPIREGDFLLVDLWAKLDKPGAVFSDYTRVAFVGSEVPEKYAKIFAIVAAARDAGIECVRSAMVAGRVLCGFEVDDAVRAVIEAAGYGEYFCHRTGHSIGQETHGNGANMDNLETHDTRRVLRRTCFSIEPGIYLTEFGVRSEVNVFVDATGEVHVTGEPAHNGVIPIP